MPLDEPHRKELSEAAKQLTAGRLVRRRYQRWSFPQDDDHAEFARSADH